MMSSLFFELVESKYIDCAPGHANANYKTFIKDDNIIIIPYADGVKFPYSVNYNTYVNNLSWVKETIPYDYMDVHMGYRFGNYILSVNSGYIRFFNKDMTLVKSVSLGASFQGVTTFQVGISGDGKSAIVSGSNNTAMAIVDSLLNVTFDTKPFSNGHRLFPIANDYFVIFNTTIDIYRISDKKLVWTGFSSSSLLSIPLGVNDKIFTWDTSSGGYTSISYLDIRPSGCTKIANSTFDRQSIHDFSILSNHAWVSEDSKMVFGVNSYKQNMYLSAINKSIQYSDMTIDTVVNYLDDLIGPTKSDKNIYYLVSRQDFNYRYHVKKIRLKEVGSK